MLEGEGGERMKQPVLLMYNLSGERARAVSVAAMRLKIRVRRVSPEEYALPLAILCGLEGETEEGAPVCPFEEEMLVMALFPAGMMNAFLQAMRRAGISPVALKAVLTPTNAAWNSVRLHEELSREREAILRGTAGAHADSQPQAERK